MLTGSSLVCRQCCGIMIPSHDWLWDKIYHQQRNKNRCCSWLFKRPKWTFVNALFCFMTQVQRRAPAVWKGWRRSMLSLAVSVIKWHWWDPSNTDASKLLTMHIKHKPWPVLLRFLHSSFFRTLILCLCKSLTQNGVHLTDTHWQHQMIWKLKIPMTVYALVLLILNATDLLCNSLWTCAPYHKHF